MKLTGNLSTDVEAFLENDEEGQRFNRDNWQRPGIPFLDEIEQIGGDLLRHHVFEAADRDRERGIVYSLVWGWPNGTSHPSGADTLKTDPRRRASVRASIQKALSDHLSDIAGRIDYLKKGYSNATEVMQVLNATAGLGTASSSKIAYFLRLPTEHGPSLIFDQQVARAILNYTEYTELADLRAAINWRKARPGDDELSSVVDATGNYRAYMEGMSKLVWRLKPVPDTGDLERFLFWLGRQRHSFLNAQEVEG